MHTEEGNAGRSTIIVQNHHHYSASREQHGKKYSRTIYLSIMQHQQLTGFLFFSIENCQRESKMNACASRKIEGMNDASP